MVGAATAVVGTADDCDSEEGRLLGTGDDGQERTRRFREQRE